MADHPYLLRLIMPLVAEVERQLLALMELQLLEVMAGQELRLL